VKYEQILSMRNDKTNDYSEHELTRLFQVSRAGYRSYAKSPEKQPKAQEIEIVAAMKSINKDHEMKCYGSPRMAVELKAQGFKISENTTAKIMRKYEIRARRKWGYKPPKTTYPDPEAKYNKNLIKDKPPTNFGQQFVTDITYIPTQEGWLYLSVMIDLYSRLVVGWETSATMPATLVTKTLDNATYNWSINTREAIFHSDRGSQYSSKKVRKWLKRNKMEQSMSHKGNCYENAHCESFFASLKAECLPDSGYFSTRAEARTRIFTYIEGFYNTRRRHSALDYHSPLDFYNLSQNQLVLAA